MTSREELDLILTLLHKYDLPISPILEYAINEKKDETINVPADNETKVITNFLDGHTDDTETFDFQAIDFNIPSNADVTNRNKYIMKFCYEILSQYENALSEREKNICKMLLVENARRRASKTYRITEERTRQIYVKSIKKIYEAHKSSMLELESLRNENKKLMSRNYLLEKEMTSTGKLENVISQEESESNLSVFTKRLLDTENELLPFSRRTKNVLKAAKIVYFKEIPQLTKEQVFHFHNCGRKTITELKSFMNQFSLDFDMTYEEILERLSNYGNEDFEISKDRNPNKQTWQENYKQMNQRDSNTFTSNADMKDCAIDKEDEYDYNSFEEHTDQLDDSSNLPICIENRGGMPWTSEEENKIVQYYEMGHSFSSIGKAIGRSEVAVMSRLGMLGKIDYTYGKKYDTVAIEPTIDTINAENVSSLEFDGMQLVRRYYYPAIDNVFCDANNQVFEIYLAENYDLVINHLVFDYDILNELDERVSNIEESEREESYLKYWNDDHINVIARIKPGTEGYDILKLDAGVGIQEIIYKENEFTVIKFVEDEESKFIDYNGRVFDTAEQIESNQISDVAKYHDFYDTPCYITKEYIRLGMIEIKRIYKGIAKKMAIFVDSELGQVIRNKSEEIWMLDGNSIITKVPTDLENEYPFKVYFCNGVRITNSNINLVKEKSLILQSQLKERISQLQRNLKKNKDRLRYERQFKEIVSNSFIFDDEPNANSIEPSNESD